MFVVVVVEWVAVDRTNNDGLVEVVAVDGWI